MRIAVVEPNALFVETRSVSKDKLSESLARVVVVIWQHVRINVQRDSRRRVTKQTRYPDDIFAIGNQKGRKCVAQGY